MSPVVPKCFDLRTNAYPSRGLDVEASVKEINEESAQYDKARREVISMIACGILSALGVGMSVYVPVAGGMLMVLYGGIVSVGALSRGLYLAHERIKACNDLNKKMESLFARTTAAPFLIKTDGRQPETAFSDEELERMKPYFDWDWDHWKYDLIVTQEMTLAKPGKATFWSAPGLTLTKGASTNDLEEVKKKYLPWRKLLRDMTLPENREKITDDADLRIVGNKTQACGTFTRNCGGLFFRKNEGGRYRIIDDGWKKIELTYNNGRNQKLAKTPDGFLNILRDALGIEIVRPVSEPSFPAN